MGIWTSLVGRIIGLSPTLLVYLIAVGLCLRHAGDQRRRAIATGLAIAIMLFSLSFSVAFGGWLFSRVNDWLRSTEMASLVIGLCYSMPSSVALLLLLWAVFYGAEHHANTDPDDDAPNS